MSQSAVPKIECVEAGESFGRFVAEPLDKGLGVTLGNALRRVLLGHLPGAAVTRVRIEGIQHEFSPIPHVKEDAIEFLLNLKSLRLKPIMDRPGKLTLDVAGEGRVCAADINPSSDFEVANPELHLAIMDSSDARLFVEFDVEMGQGYREAEAVDNMPLGLIPVDAIFTPMRKVNYFIEPIHVGRESGKERLVLEVWTDGTIEPGDAVSRSAEILADMFTAFVNYGTPAAAEMEKDLAELSMSEEQYNMPVEQLGLSVRTMNCLRRGNIATVGELISRGEKGLLALRNFGQKSKIEIEERLNELGLSLNPQAEETEEEAGSAAETGDSGASEEDTGAGDEDDLVASATEAMLAALNEAEAEENRDEE